MIKSIRIYILVIAIGILSMAVSCDYLSIDTQEKLKEETTSHDAAIKSSRYLLQMDDMKAINLAANYLKELGEPVVFQETYIEYHDAGESALNIALSGEKSLDYLGDYLEVRLYQRDEESGNPCEHCTIVYISQDGKILGFNKY